MANYHKHPNRNRRAHCRLCKPWKSFHAGKRHRAANKQLATKVFAEYH